MNVVQYVGRGNVWVSSDERFCGAPARIKKITLVLDQQHTSSFPIVFDKLKTGWTDFIHPRDNTKQSVNFNEVICNENFEQRKFLLRKIMKRYKMRNKHGHNPAKLYYGSISMCTCGALTFEKFGVPVSVTNEQEEHLICPNQNATGTYKLYPKE